MSGEFESKKDSYPINIELKIVYRSYESNVNS